MAERAASLAADLRMIFQLQRQKFWSLLNGDTHFASVEPFNFHQHSDVKGSKWSSSVENYLKTTGLCLHGLVKVTFLTHCDFLSQHFLSVASWSLVFGAPGLGAVELGVEGGIAAMGCRSGSADTSSALPGGLIQLWNPLFPILENEMVWYLPLLRPAT